MQARKDTFIGLEWLRFFLGIYLVMYHTLPFYEGYEALDGLVEFNELGFFATSCFFALSGFLLAHVYLDGDRLREPPLSILAKRFANLYPIHLFALACSIGVILVTGLVDSNTDLHLVYRADDLLKRTAPEQLPYRMDDVEMAVNAVLQLGLLHAWNPVFLAYNGPLWSISALFFFYAVFPWFAPRLAKSPHKVQLLLAIWLACLIPPLIVVMSGDYSSTALGFLHHFPLFRLPVFLGGILAYLLFRQYRLGGSGLRGPIKLLTVVAIGIGISIAAELNWHGGHHWYVLLHNGLMMPMVLATVGLCAMVAAPASETHRRWARRLGGASLPLFALHTPVFIVFRRLEMLAHIDYRLCMTDAAACVAQAKAAPLSLAFYPLLLLVTVAFCVIFQEQFVSRLRQWLLSGPLRRAVQPPAKRLPDYANAV
ncbi:acyltransferase [Stutzerimonas urumqiensis]|uniref:acyltransferase family protein n=1 Tax=Stutzerimonas urumqiensis TaxID=638269 RepID=UPI003BAB264D